MTGKVISFAEVADDTLKAAAKIRACGVNAGDHVMLYSPNNENYIATLLGIMSIGAIPCLANPAYTGRIYFRLISLISNCMSYPFINFPDFTIPLLHFFSLCTL